MEKRSRKGSISFSFYVFFIFPPLTTEGWLQPQFLLTLSEPFFPEPLPLILSPVLFLDIYPEGCAKSLQSCPTLCNPLDCSPPGSSVHGILQARILEWVSISSSRESSWPRKETSCASSSGRWDLYHWCYLGSPYPEVDHMFQMTGAKSVPEANSWEAQITARFC